MRDRILFTRLDKKLMLCNLLFGPTYITPRIELGSIYPYCVLCRLKSGMRAGPRRQGILQQRRKMFHFGFCVAAQILIWSSSSSLLLRSVKVQTIKLTAARFEVAPPFQPKNFADESSVMRFVQYIKPDTAVAGNTWLCSRRRQP